MSKDRAWDDEGNRNDDDDDDDRPRRRSRGRDDDDDDDDDDRPRRKRRRQSSGDSTGKVLLILFGIGFACVVACCGGCGLLVWKGGNDLQASNPVETDDLHNNALAGGNVDKIYESADPEFKKKYTRNELSAFVSSHSSCFERKNLWGGTLRTRYGREDYKTIDSKTGLFDPGVRIYFIKSKTTSKYIFAGISPGLDGTIPESLRFDPNNPEMDE